MAGREDRERDATSTNRWLRRDSKKSEIVSEGTVGRQRERERGREREGEKNLDQAEKGLEFTLGNAVSRTGKT